MIRRLPFYLALAALIAAVGLHCSSTPNIAVSTPADDFPNAVCGVVKDEGGSPVMGAQVFVRPASFLADTGGAPPAPDAITDATGTFRLDSLANGRYIIEISRDTLGTALPCSLYSREKRLMTVPEQQIVPFGAVTGKVQYTGQNPVYVRTYGLVRATRIDSVTGDYRIGRMPPGTYSLQVSAFVATVPPVTIGNVTVESSFPTVVDPVTLQTFNEEDYSQWSYSRTIHLETTPLGANVTDTVFHFPVLVRLDPSTIAFSQASADGRDIRFARPGGAHLHYEIERWDAANRSAAVWVRVDTLYGNATTDIVMYWGRKNAADFSQGSSVFGSTDGYLGVWHMSDQTDATGQGHTLVTQSGSTTPASDTGLAGGAMRFDGVDDFWSVPYAPGIDGNNRFSISVWAQWQGSQVPGYNRIISNKRAWDDSAGFELLTISGNDSAIDVRAEDSIGNGPLHVIDGWKAHGWHYITLVWNNGTCAIYVDGVLADAPLINAYSTPNDLVFGSNVGNTEAKWNGHLDEIRMSNGPLSAGWIKLCYMNQKPLDALCKY
jgi:Concanavalin A-like lectin/glucanases superfamily/Domain of unknown function (DUF2341)